jgi:hypothetical protein
MKIRTLAAVILSALLAGSIPLAIYAYYAGSFYLFSVFEALSSFALWISIIGLLFLFPLRYIPRLFTKYLKSFRGALTFGGYWTVHLIVYGVLLEGILAYGFKINAIVHSLFIGFASIPVYPLSFYSIITGFGFNPGLDLLIPPVYEVDLSFYIIAISFVIATLVVTNIMKVGEIRKMCHDRSFGSRNLVLLPTLGLVGGASCCLSIPILIELAAPVAAVASYIPIVYFLAYLLFPSATVIGLKYNMDSTNRMSSKMETILAHKNVKADLSKASLRSTDKNSTVGGA